MNKKRKYHQINFTIFAININGLQAAIAVNTRNCLRKTDKERALKRLQRLFGFARPLTKKNKY